MKALTFDLRTKTTRGLVVACNDNGCAQTVDVQTHQGITRSGVEVHQPFGFNSVPPPNGGVTVLLANGGDPGDMIALPVAVAFARFGGLLAGEVVVYGADGSRVHVRQGGTIEIFAATEVHIKAPSVVIDAANGMTVNGSLTVNGDASITGSLSTGGAEAIGADLSVDGNVTASGTISGG